MMTASEITDRKKARRLLDIKRIALEEAVEKAVCEKVYGRIYRHRTTDDEERDQKLRSRIAALSIVGIGLKELLVNSDAVDMDSREDNAEKEKQIKEWLAQARDSLLAMNDEQSPLGKLQKLSAAHKSIVESLSKLFPSSSSADEILPTLIYTLITSLPEHISVISNLLFIQRFRASAKLDGEAAYCLVNLEAAISFLETVDLASLRSDELPEGPDRSSSRPSTPRTELPSSPMQLGISPATTPRVSPTSATQSPLGGSRPGPNNRISQLITAQTNKIENASDSFRGFVNESADSALDAVSSTFDNSFKFLFGRLKEQQAHNKSEDDKASNRDVLPVPKTLEDARKLVNTPPLGVDDDAASVSQTSETDEKPDSSDHFDDPLRSKPDAKPSRDTQVLEFIGGRKHPSRDRSVDSQRSQRSASSSITSTGKRVAFADGKKPEPIKTDSSSPASAIAVAAPAGPLDGMRSFSNSLNPLTGFSRMGGLFGRGPLTPTGMEKNKELSSSPVPSATEPDPDLAAAKPTTSVQAGLRPLSKEEKALLAVEDLKKVTLSKKFIEMKDAKEVRVGEVEELLIEYQRLAGTLRGVLKQ